MNFIPFSSLQLGKDSVLEHRKPPIKTKKWFGFLSGDKETKETVLPLKTLSDDDKKRIYDEVQNAEEDKKKVVQKPKDPADDLPKTYVNFDIDGELKELQLVLSDYEHKPIVDLSITDVKVGAKMHARGNICIVGHIWEVVMIDHYTKGSVYRKIISVIKKAEDTVEREFVGVRFPDGVIQNQEKDGVLRTVVTKTDVAGSNGDPKEKKDPFISFKVDYKPLSDPSDLVIDLTIFELQTVIHAEWLTRVARFFVDPDFKNAPLQISNVNAENRSHVTALKEVSRHFQYVGDNDEAPITNAVKLVVNISSPAIVLPMNPTDENAEVWVVDLGRLTTRSTNQSKGDIARINQRLKGFMKDVNFDKYSDATVSVPTDILRSCYDVFDVRLSNIEIFGSRSGKNWRDDLKGDPKRTHILNKVNIDVSVEMAVAFAPSLLPTTRILGKLEDITLNAGAEQLHQLKTTLETFDFSKPAPPGERGWISEKSVPTSLTTATESLSSAVVNPSLSLGGGMYRPKAALPTILSGDSTDGDSTDNEVFLDAHTGDTTDEEYYDSKVPRRFRDQQRLRFSGDRGSDSDDSEERRSGSEDDSPVRSTSTELLGDAFEDDRLDASELMAILHVTRDVADKIIGEIDEDGDNLIDRKEFNAFVEKRILENRRKQVCSVKFTVESFNLVVKDDSLIGKGHSALSSRKTSSIREVLRLHISNIGAIMVMRSYDMALELNIDEIYLKAPSVKKLFLKKLRLPPKTSGAAFSTLDYTEEFVPYKPLNTTKSSTLGYTGLFEQQRPTYFALLREAERLRVEDLGGSTSSFFKLLYVQVFLYFILSVICFFSFPFHHFSY